MKSYYIGLTRVLSTKLQQTVRLQMKSAMIDRSTPLNVTKLVGIFSITRFVTSFVDTRPRIMLPTERARNTGRNIKQSYFVLTVQCIFRVRTAIQSQEHLPFFSHDSSKR